MDRENKQEKNKTKKSKEKSEERACQNVIW